MVAELFGVQGLGALLGTLYTGSAIVDGHDLLRAEVEQVVSEAGLIYEYSEIDPDVFGEELEAASYRDVERIAAVSLVVCG